MSRARWKARDNALDTDIPATARILAISSGKGGVGKSSVTANLAVLLADRGYTVGVLDADVGGFSMPRLLGIDGEIEAERAGEGKTVMKPVVREIGDGVLHVVSMGSISGANENEAIMWRGLMLNRAVQHFLEDVQWGDLDYLLIDMPPGTSDIQMGLARMLPRTDVVIVTTPAMAAQQVAARAADMARKGFLRVAGVIENMGPSATPDGTVTAMFGSGGGQHARRQHRCPAARVDPARRRRRRRWRRRACRLHSISPTALQRSCTASWPTSSSTTSPHRSRSPNAAFAAR